MRRGEMRRGGIQGPRQGNLQLATQCERRGDKEGRGVRGWRQRLGEGRRLVDGGHRAVFQPLAICQHCPPHSSTLACTPSSIRCTELSVGTTAQNSASITAASSCGMPCGLRTPWSRTDVNLATTASGASVREKPPLPPSLATCTSVARRGGRRTPPPLGAGGSHSTTLVDLTTA